MDKKVEFLKKKDIKKYIEFIDNVFNYIADSKVIENLINSNTVLVIKDNDKIIASAMLEERFEYIKNKKYYYLSYLGVLKKYRREGYATKLFEKIDEMSRKNNINYLELTSGNHRRDAYYFYKSKDFKIKQLY